MKKYIVFAPIVALCLALFAACPNRIIFPPPQIVITIDSTADFVNRGGSLPLRATVLNLEDVFETNTIVWTIVEHEIAGAIVPAFETGTGIESTTNYAANPYPAYHTSLIRVNRHESPGNTVFTVRARLHELSALYTTLPIEVRIPVAVADNVEITSPVPSVHRGAVTPPLTAQIDWQGGLYPLQGDRGVFFEAYNGEPGTIASPVSVPPGQPALQGTVAVSLNQPHREGGTLYVRAVSHYYNGFYSEPFDINILTPVAQWVSVAMSPRVSSEGGVHRGEDEANPFTATVTGLGNPPNTVTWSVDGNPAGVTFGAVDTATANYLTVDRTVMPGQYVTVRATSAYLGQQGQFVSGPQEVFILYPVIVHVNILHNGIHAPSAAEIAANPALVVPVTTATRGVGSVTFTTVVDGRGYPEDIPGNDHVYWSIPVTGINHRTGITSDGSLTVSGHEFLGQIRVRATSRNNPQALSNFYVDIIGTHPIAGVGWRAVSVGQHHALALTTEHHLFSWGRHHQGILGHILASDDPIPVPLRIPDPVVGGGGTPFPAEGWRMATAGANHNIAITADNRLFGWGSNDWGQLGDTPAPGAPVATPTNIQGAVGHFWINADVGPYHTVGVKEMGTLYTFGRNIPTLIGRPNVALVGDDRYDGELRPHYMPGRVMVHGLSDYGWKTASAGTDHTAAIRVDGSLWVWGRNDWGQLGLGVGNSGLATRPVRVHHPVAGRHWESVNAGDRFTIAIDNEGTLHVWGRNELGQLGQSHPGHVEAPIVPGLELGIDNPGHGRTWSYINSMTNHSIAMAVDGELFVFGSNELGQFGNGFAVAGHVPGIMMSPVLDTGTNRFLFANVGGGSTMAVDTLGNMFAWGANEYFQLGLGHRRPANDPGQLPPTVAMPDNVLLGRYFELRPQPVVRPPQ